MFIVALESSGTRHYIAGHPTADRELVGVPGAQTIEHKRKQVAHEGAGWPEEINKDLGNVGTIINGRTTRTFATIYEADEFAADLTGMIFEGALVLLSEKTPGVFAKRTSSYAVASVRVEGQVGCAVTLGYTVRAGILYAAEDENYNTRTTDDDTVRTTDDDTERKTDA